ncbi:MAG: tRNA (adenosine(37)-N6)-dimethylallyltransferase MiaA [Candidatus Nanopelagicales bacterium]|nr:tRNA (adenosine(37)-N6)-dimethylallyltransferase MiaA [Candidatus Nanopelagicales bacterium]
MKVLAIVGPTAVGKSALAIAVAKRCRGEIINTDSMQLYVGMNIGTATPSLEERDGIPHHLVDIWPPDHEVAVAEFQQLARSEIDDVISRGAQPIVVGGSGLYVAGVLDDLKFPATDPKVRTLLEAELLSVGPAAMHAKLLALDPVAAAAILPTNGRRIVRALEVIALTGEPFVATLPPPVSVYPTVRIGLEIARPELDERIAQRVQAMWDAGFVQEVRELGAAGLANWRTASRALGYLQILAYLNGDCTEPQARQATIDATIKFARRQQRWFRHDERINWINYDSSDAAARVLAALGLETLT